MRLEEYLNNCGVPQITSETIFFKPNIPDRKLSNAIKAYGGGLGKGEVIVLIDDTSLGSAKEGVLITEESLFFKVDGYGMGYRDLSSLSDASSKNSYAVLNGEAIFKLKKPSVYELGYLFSKLGDFLANRVPVNDEGEACSSRVELDVTALAEICTVYTTPVFYTAQDLKAQGAHPSFIDRKPAKTPCFYVIDNIPPVLSKTARFCLRIPEQDTVVALSDLTSNAGGAADAFVVTQRGLYSRNGKEQPTIFIPWDVLKQRSVIEEIQVEQYWAVKLDDGTVLTVSNRNVIVRPYGMNLIRDLIRFAATGEHKPQSPRLPTANAVRSPEPTQTKTQPANRWVGYALIAFVVGVLYSCAR